MNIRTISTELHLHEIIFPLNTGPSIKTAVWATPGDVFRSFELPCRALAFRYHIGRNTNQGGTVSVDEKRVALNHQFIGTASFTLFFETFVNRYHSYVDA